ncbi:MAG: hypothetical protein A3G81_11960 [Betaproteobacteria bacterium RIFCSPLOWO2_12_FULL_65_14]|nr:MAG: hypothetical protein A3G81_11960 [Betaproteobacteria bacterium RIFCSPLOWO2_12_FULL_65_14]
MARGDARELGVMRLERRPLERRALHDRDALLQQVGGHVERDGGGHADQRHMHRAQIADVLAAMHDARELELRAVLHRLRAGAPQPSVADDRNATPHPPHKRASSSARAG